jgi:hypothetical protein
MFSQKFSKISRIIIPDQSMNKKFRKFLLTLKKKDKKFSFSHIWLLSFLIFRCWVLDFIFTFFPYDSLIREFFPVTKYQLEIILNSKQKIFLIFQIKITLSLNLILEGNLYFVFLLKLIKILEQYPFQEKNVLILFIPFG